MIRVRHLCVKDRHGDVHQALAFSAQLGTPTLPLILSPIREWKFKRGRHRDYEQICDITFSYKGSPPITQENARSEHCAPKIRRKCSMRSSLLRWQNGRVPARIGLRYQRARPPLSVARRQYAAVASLEELAAAGHNGKPTGKVIRQINAK